jgi:hypothetical protein
VDLSTLAPLRALRTQIAVLHSPGTSALDDAIPEELRSEFGRRAAHYDETAEKFRMLGEFGLLAQIVPKQLAGRGGNLSDASSMRRRMSS